MNTLTLSASGATIGAHRVNLSGNITARVWSFVNSGAGTMNFDNFTITHQRGHGPLRRSSSTHRYRNPRSSVAARPLP